MNRKLIAAARRLTRSLTVLGLCAGPALAQSLPTPEGDSAFEAAMQAYERNHWQAAYAAFAALADAGHAESARIAMQMWRHGPTLYGIPFVAEPRQMESWSRLRNCTPTLSADPSA